MKTTDSGDKDSAAFKKAENPRSSRSLAAGFILVLVIVCVLAYKSGMDPRQIRADVDAFRDSITERYAGYGAEVSLNYDQVDVEGGIFSKSVTLSAPRLKIIGEKAAYSLEAPSVTLHPEDEAFSAFRMELASPVTIAHGKPGGTSDYQMRYTTTAPVVIDVLKNQDGAWEYAATPQSGAMIEATRKGHVRQYTIEHAADALVSGVFSEQASGSYTLSADMADIVVTHEDERFTTSQFAYGLSMEEGVQQVSLALQDVTSTLVPDALEPLQAEVERRTHAGTAQQEEVIELERFDVKGAGFNVDVHGTIAVHQSELLPLVDLSASIDGAATLLEAVTAQDYIPASLERVLISSLERMAPDWKQSSPAPLKFNIRRGESEPFMLGAVKADELFAVALREYLSSESTQEEAPASGETTSEPSLGGAIPAVPSTQTDGDKAVIEPESTPKDAKDTDEGADAPTPQEEKSSESETSGSVDSALDALNNSVAEQSPASDAPQPKATSEQPAIGAPAAQ